MMVGKPEMLFVKSDRVQEYIGAIKSAAQSQTPDMVVVFLAQKRADKLVTNVAVGLCINFQSHSNGYVLVLPGIVP